jgi:gag-polypeptide of LTR copia-type
MSAIPSLTILSEEQKFNGDNLLQWTNNITQLLGAKGLMGYIDGNIPKPAQSPTPAKDAPISGTPIYSTTPTLDEWNFRDQLTRGHITLNCTDVASLGVIITGTARDAWKSIESEWGKSTDMRRSHAQEALNRTEYMEGNDVQDHIKLLRTRKAAVDNLSTEAMSDEAWRGIIIRSIPPTPKWLPVIPSLYSMTTAADIVSTLLAHGMILRRGSTTNSSSTALAAHTNNSEGCKNPDCKAKDRSTHKTDDCYWPGGGKEGQFPVNFGQRSKANITVTSDSPSQQTEHFVLSARVTDTPGQSGILFDEPAVSSVGEQVSTPLATPLNTIPLDNTREQVSTPLDTIPLDTTIFAKTDNITITDTSINDDLASANQPGTTASGISVIVHYWHNPDHHPYQNITDTSMMDPIKLQRSNQTLQLGPNSFNIIELGYANNTTSNSFTITPLTDTKPDEPNILNILNTIIEADNSDPAINTSNHHHPVNQTDQRLRNIAVITAKSVILRVKVQRQTRNTISPGSTDIPTSRLTMTTSWVPRALATIRKLLVVEGEGMNIVFRGVTVITVIGMGDNEYGGDVS